MRAELVGVLGRLAGGPWLELPDPAHEPEEVRRRADDILSRSEYQWDDSENVLDRIARWIADRLGDVGGPAGVDGSLPTWVGWAVLVALGLLIAFIVYRMRHNLRLNPKVPVPEGTVVVAEGEDDVDWAAEAERHEAAGRWRDALRCRYRALVGELGERRVIPDLVGRTAGEFVADVARTNPPASPAFSAATDLFERAWYGGEDTGPDERDRFAGLAREVLATATAPIDGGGSGGPRPLAVPV